ncbi:hypothetical protein Aduo_019236 [Ancylostoma duodenale]
MQPGFATPTAFLHTNFRGTRGHCPAQQPHSTTRPCPSAQPLLACVRATRGGEQVVSRGMWRAARSNRAVRISVAHDSRRARRARCLPQETRWPARRYTSFAEKPLCRMVQLGVGLIERTNRSVDRRQAGSISSDATNQVAIIRANSSTARSTTRPSVRCFSAHKTRLFASTQPILAFASPRVQRIAAYDDQACFAVPSPPYQSIPLIFTSASAFICYLLRSYRKCSDQIAQVVRSKVTEAFNHLISPQTPLDAGRALTQVVCSSSRLTHFTSRLPDRLDPALTFARYQSAPYSSSVEIMDMTMRRLCSFPCSRLKAYAAALTAHSFAGSSSCSFSLSVPGTPSAYRA